MFRGLVDLIPCLQLNIRVGILELSGVIWWLQWNHERPCNYDSLTLNLTASEAGLTSRGSTVG